LHCDVLIVGGGPAGSTCAWKLRRSGLRVVVMDAKRFPRDKVCAGWITPQILETLEIDPDDYAKESVLQPFRGFEVGRLGGRSTRVTYSEVVSYGIRRCEFDTRLLLRCGAELRQGEPLRSLVREGVAWLANGELRAKLVVGAGGHFRSRVCWRPRAETWTPSSPRKSSRSSSTAIRSANAASRPRCRSCTSRLTCAATPGWCARGRC
jgi:flavin-dependent dehydrogenase